DPDFRWQEWEVRRDVPSLTYRPSLRQARDGLRKIVRSTQRGTLRRAVPSLAGRSDRGPLILRQGAMLSTILPRLCGAPASISWAARASSSGSTVPTSGRIFRL